jgi:hypothetical protein
MIFPIPPSWDKKVCSRDVPSDLSSITFRAKWDHSRHFTVACSLSEHTHRISLAPGSYTLDTSEENKSNGEDEGTVKVPTKKEKRFCWVLVDEDDIDPIEIKTTYLAVVDQEIAGKSVMASINCALNVYEKDCLLEECTAAFARTLSVVRSAHGEPKGMWLLTKN